MNYLIYLLLQYVASYRISYQYQYWTSNISLSTISHIGVPPVNSIKNSYIAQRGAILKPDTYFRLSVILRVRNREESILLPYTLSKMSPLSTSVYSSVFTYNPNVLTRRNRQLTTKTSIELHHVTCVLLDTSDLFVRFGDLAHSCRVQAIRNALAILQQKFLGCSMNRLIMQRSGTPINSSLAQLALLCASLRGA